MPCRMPSNNQMLLRKRERNALLLRGKRAPWANPRIPVPAAGRSPAASLPSWPPFVNPKVPPAQRRGGGRRRGGGFVISEWAQSTTTPSASRAKSSSWCSWLPWNRQKVHVTHSAPTPPPGESAMIMKKPRWSIRAGVLCFAAVLGGRAGAVKSTRAAPSRQRRSITSGISTRSTARRPRRADLDAGGPVEFASGDILRPAGLQGSATLDRARRRRPDRARR